MDDTIRALERRCQEGDQTAFWSLVRELRRFGDLARVSDLHNPGGAAVAFGESLVDQGFVKRERILRTEKLERWTIECSVPFTFILAIPFEIGPRERFATSINVRGRSLACAEFNDGFPVTIPSAVGRWNFSWFGKKVSYSESVRLAGFVGTFDVTATLFSFVVDTAPHSPFVLFFIGSFEQNADPVLSAATAVETFEFLPAILSQEVAGLTVQELAQRLHEATAIVPDLRTPTLLRFLDILEDSRGRVWSAAFLDAAREALARRDPAPEARTRVDLPER